MFRLVILLLVMGKSFWPHSAFHHNNHFNWALSRIISNLNKMTCWWQKGDIRIHHCMKICDLQRIKPTLIQGLVGLVGIFVEEMLNFIRFPIKSLTLYEFGKMFQILRLGCLSNGGIARLVSSLIHSLVLIKSHFKGYLLPLWVLFSWILNKISYVRLSLHVKV